MARSSLNADKRRTTLAEMLMQGKRVSISAQAKRFGVHEMTVRRDLDALEEAGMVVRCYGGGIPAHRLILEFEFDQRRRRNLRLKKRIASLAAGKISPGQTVILDTGTTTGEVAKSLSTRALPCMVVTNSLATAGALWASEPIDLMLLGGRVRRASPDLIGPDVELMLDRLSADVAILGADGIDPDRGCFAVDLEAGRVAERMAASARRVIVVADSTKFNRPAPVRYLQTADMDELVTDKAAPGKALATLRRKGVKVTTV